MVSGSCWGVLWTECESVVRNHIDDHTTTPISVNDPRWMLRTAHQPSHIAGFRIRDAVPDLRALDLAVLLEEPWRM